MNLILRSCQADDVRFMCENSHGALLHPPGYGKTVSAILAYLALKERRRVRSLLVVAPTSTVLSSWPDEIRKWDQFRRLTVAVLHGENKELLRQHRADIYLINAEGLLWLTELPSEVDMVVIDESTKFRNMTSKRTRLLVKLIKDVERRFIMSGSLIDEGLEVLQGQIALMDGGITFGTSEKYFNEKYFQKVGPRKMIPLPGAWEDAMALIKNRVRHVSLEEAGIKLDPLEEQIIPVTMPQRAWQLHNDLQRDLVSYSDDGVIAAANKEAATMSMRQITGGAMIVRSELAAITGSVMTIHEAKLEALQQIADATLKAGKKLAVTYCFDHERQRIGMWMRDFSIGAIHGHDGDRAETVRRWNRGAFDLLLINYQAASHGLNLQDIPSDVAMYTPTWSAEDDYQVIRRFHRSGQTQKVRVKRLLVPGSIDDVVYGVVTHKYTDKKAAIEYLRSRTCGS